MKREIEYKGFVVTVWEKSFRIDGCPVVYVGADPQEFAKSLEHTIMYVLRKGLKTWLKGER
jgi:hypothetical protein